MSTRFRDIETKLVHCGERAVEGAVCLPVFQSVTFASRPEDGYHDVRYIRLNNTPNHQLLLPGRVRPMRTPVIVGRID